MSLIVVLKHLLGDPGYSALFLRPLFWETRSYYYAEIRIPKYCLRHSVTLRACDLSKSLVRRPRFWDSVSEDPVLRPCNLPFHLLLVGARVWPFHVCIPAGGAERVQVCVGFAGHSWWFDPAPDWTPLCHDYELSAAPNRFQSTRANILEAPSQRFDKTYVPTPQQIVTFLQKILPEKRSPRSKDWSLLLVTIPWSSLRRFYMHFWSIFVTEIWTRLIFSFPCLVFADTDFF